MKLDLILITVIISSLCYNNIEAKFETKNNSFVPIEDDTSMLRFDGIYSDYDTVSSPDDHTQKIIGTEFVAFLKDSHIFYSGEGVSGIYPDFQGFFKTNGPNLTGTYHISNDTLYATISTLFFKRGMRFTFLDANYVGYIKNKDTISAWKMVPPYPKMNLRLNEHFENFTRPRDLHFVKYEQVKELEEITKKDEN